MPFIASFLLLSILRYACLTTNPKKDLCANFSEQMLVSAKWSQYLTHCYLLLCWLKKRSLTCTAYKINTLKITLLSIHFGFTPLKRFPQTSCTKWHLFWRHLLGYRATGRLKFGIILRTGTTSLQHIWKTHMMKAIFLRYRALKRCIL